MGANIASLVIVVVAVFLVIVGLRGTQADVFGSLFSNVKLPGQSSSGNSTGGSAATTASGVDDGTGGSSGGGTSATGGTSPTTQGYTFSQLAALAQQAGFSLAQSYTAAAIALAESAGNPAATGPYGERGLWQVYPAAHPDLAAQFNLYDPLQNAQAAHAVFLAQGWGAWTTYLNGAYRQFLNSSTTAL